jgi:hypothetical protein
MSAKPLFLFAFSTNHPVQISGKCLKMGKALYLDESNLVGNFQCVCILGQLNKSLLLAIRSNQSVDLLNLDIVKLGNSIFDLILVGTDITNEDECVVGFDLLHGSFSGEWCSDDGELVQLVDFVDGFAGILWCTGKFQGLGQVETG